jgi:hypothetical protein
MGASIGGIGGAPFGGGMRVTFGGAMGASMGGGMGSPMGGFIYSMVATIPPPSGGIGALSGGGMGSYMSNEEVAQDGMEENMRRDVGLRYFYPLSCVCVEFL